MLRDLLSLVFPRSCPGCARSLVRTEGAVCLECIMEIQETGFHESPDDNEMYMRLAGRVPLDGAAAFYYFDKKGRFRNIIQGLKYHNIPQVGQELGEMYGAQLQDSKLMEGIGAIVPVPLHKSRLAERGYNQAEAIAKGLSLSLELPVVKDCLVREAKTVTQTKRGKTERWDNVKGVFEVKKPLTTGILLVDDIVTTGSTIEACIRALQDHDEKPSRVCIVALGMARHE